MSQIRDLSRILADALSFPLPIYHLLNTSELNGTEDTPTVPPFPDPCPPGQRLDYKGIGNALENVSSVFNKTYPPTWESGLKITFYALAILMAVIGNSLVMLVIVCNKRLHTRTYVYIANLAVSDFMVGIFNMWVHLGGNISPDYPFPAIICKLFSFFQSQYAASG